jgi:hypothetical protein
MLYIRSTKIDIDAQNKYVKSTEALNQQPAIEHPHSPPTIDLIFTTTSNQSSLTPQTHFIIASSRRRHYPGPFTEGIISAMTTTF